MAKKNIKRFDSSLNNDPNFASIGKTIDIQDSILSKYGFDKIQDILNEPFVYGCFQSRINKILAQEWQIIQNGATDKEYEIVKESMDMLIQDGIIQKIMLGRFISPTGIYLEWITNDYWYPVSSDVINPERIKFGVNSELRITTKNQAMDGIEVDNRNFLICTENATKTNPYGQSLLTRLYNTQFVKRNLLKFWAVFAEKFGMPWVVAMITDAYIKSQQQLDTNYHPDDALTDVLDTLDATITDGILVGKEGVEISVSQATNNSTDIYNTFMTELKKEISFLILGHENAGMATAGQLGGNTEAIVVMQDILDSDKSYVQHYLGKVVDYIYDVNFGDSKNKAYLQFYQKDNIENYKAKAEVTNMLAADGKVKFTEDYYKKEFNLQDEYIESVNTPIQTSPTAINVRNANRDLQSMVKTDQFLMQGAEPDSDSVQFEEYVANSKTYKNAVAKQQKPIIDFVLSQDTYDKIMEDLFSVYTDMDTEDLQDVLLRAGITTHIKGFSDSEIEAED